MLKSTENLFGEDKQQQHHQKMNNSVYYNIESDFDSSIELDEYDVYDELEERGLYSVDDSRFSSDTEMDEKEFASMIDNMPDSRLPDNSLLSSISDYEDDDDDDDESIDYFDLEEAAELAGIPFPHSQQQSSSSCSMLSCEFTSMTVHHANPSELIDAKYHHHAPSISISSSVVAIQVDHEPAMPAPKITTHPSITYRRNMALGCLSPPQSPDLLVDTSNNTTEHSLPVQQSQTQVFKYNNGDDETDYSSEYDMTASYHHQSNYSSYESHSDGYAGDAWQTWGDPESSEVNRDWINSLTNDAHHYWNELSSSHQYAMMDGDDDRYSPNDDWIYGAYGITKSQ
jgi:hypothetical protein